MTGTDPLAKTPDAGTAHMWGVCICIIPLALVGPAASSSVLAQASSQLSAALAFRSKGPAKSPKPRYDYSRYSDGPRRVPRPRGASARRARALGLGTLEAGRYLLRHPPKAKWLRAARGPARRDLLWPVATGRFGRGFGFTRRERKDLRHNGVDIGADRGAVVRAAGDGIVAYSDNGIRGFGNCVILIHKNGSTTLYAHNERTTVQAGYRVRRGERIALVGATGIARGPHLHFEYRDRGRPRDPEPLFIERPGRRRRSRSRAEPDKLVAGARVGNVQAVERLMEHPKRPEGKLRSRLRRAQGLAWPLRGGKLTRRYRAARPPGLDLRATRSRSVRAAADAIVVYSGRKLEGRKLKGYGRTVVLWHRNGWLTVYAHNARNLVKTGQVVRRGQRIARAGRRRARHPRSVRFELIRDGRWREPSRYFRRQR